MVGAKPSATERAQEVLSRLVRKTRRVVMGSHWQSGKVAKWQIKVCLHTNKNVHSGATSDPEMLNVKQLVSKPLLIWPVEI